MVYVNGTKFSCASCIKGHRSSSCHHSDRPLFEIKKKGRPISQCEKCRELRRNKRMHVRCTCGESSSSLPSYTAERPPSTSSPPHTVHPRRRVPTVPSLPNGISDIYKSQTEFISNPHPKQRVVNLLNPCQCPSLWNCTCSPTKSNRRAKADITRQFSTLEYSGGGYRLHQDSTGRDGNSWRFGEDLKLPPLKGFGTDKGRREHGDTHTGTLLPPFSTFCANDVDPFKRCTCGSACICIGCKEHRRSVDTGATDCPDNCGTCVDNFSSNELLPISR